MQPYLSLTALHLKEITVLQFPDNYITLNSMSSQIAIDACTVYSDKSNFLTNSNLTSLHRESALIFR